MKKSSSLITATIVMTISVGLFFGTAGVVVPAALAAPPKSPLQSTSHVTVQNTTTSVQDPLCKADPGHCAHQAAIVLPPRADGKLWVGTVTWTSSKPVELVVLHGYTNVTADAAHGVPLTTKQPSGTLAITLIGPTQFMPASESVPSGTAPFVGNAVAFHTLSGAKFTVTYSVDATANTPTKIK